METGSQAIKRMYTMRSRYTARCAFEPKPNFASGLGSYEPPAPARAPGRRTPFDGGARALGYSLSAILRVRPAPRELKKTADLARETREVVECHRITGDDCYIMKIHVRDVEHLEEVIDRFAGYGQTTTSIMQSSPVPGRGVALDGSSGADRD